MIRSAKTMKQYEMLPFKFAHLLCQVSHQLKKVLSVESVNHYLIIIQFIYIVIIVSYLMEDVKEVFEKV